MPRKRSFTPSAISQIRWTVVEQQPATQSAHNSNMEKEDHCWCRNAPIVRPTSRCGKSVALAAACALDARRAALEDLMGSMLAPSAIGPQNSLCSTWYSFNRT
uniref:Uncharacterized protein n=1 Tax=Noctiluca scintillans TaxID=2966 RepID=A7WQA8_NOCSC|nr:unknown [Noctiluca scintillans]ABV22401.1 unknown [Noctiluca scintillans]ABV22402.1 unknown [Noctiluca scintillans]ABV22403.1 unknown [Noctiluca scintillans]